MLQSRIRRGELDREISFIEKVIAVGDSNEDKETGWKYLTNEPTVWARVRVGKGKDMIISDRLTNIQSVQFTIDYREDVTTQMRVFYKSKAYEIISIAEDEDGRERYLNVMGNILDSEVINPTAGDSAHSSAYSRAYG